MADELTPMREPPPDCEPNWRDDDWADTCADDNPPRTVPPLHPWDLRGQLTDVERAHIEDIAINRREYL